MEITDEQFVEIVRSSRRPSNVLANQLSVSTPTVRRWKNGRNLPGQALRLAVTKHIQETNARYTEPN